MEFIQNIQALADGREQISIRKEFSDEEKNAMQEQHVKNAIRIKNLNEEVKAINDSKRVISKESSKIVEKIQLGFIDDDVDCFYIDNHSEGSRKYYDSYGNLVNSRKLRPDERTMRLPLAANS